MRKKSLSAVGILVILSFLLTPAGFSTWAEPTPPMATKVATGPTIASPAAKALAKVMAMDFLYVSIPGSPSQENFDKFFTPEVNKRTGGRIKVSFHPGTIATKETQIVDMVKSGAAQIGTPLGAVASVFPETEPLILPYMYRDYDHVYKVLNGPIGEKIKNGVEQKHKIKHLFWYDYGFRQFWNSKRPINKPEDLKGLKMRVMMSKPLVELVNALGASAVPMAWGEVIPAMQQGVIDGGDLPVVNIEALKVYEVAKYASLTSHVFFPTMVFMNQDTWNSLDKKDQDMFLQLSRETSKRIVGTMLKADNSAKELLEPKGMKVNEVADKKPFIDLARKDVWSKYESKYGKELIESIVNTK